MPREYEGYFEKGEEGSTVAPSIRAMCHFARFNLLDATSAAMFGRVDVIFCRNVLIYLDDGARRMAAENLFENLAPGGFLCLGHTESMSRISPLFDVCRYSDAIVYQRPLGARHG